MYGAPASSPMIASALFAAVLTGCAPGEPENPVTPIAEVAPIPVEPAPAAPPAPPPEPEPEPAEYCDAEGWCRPYAVLPFGWAASARDAVAVSTSEGVVALWADGRWQGGFTAAPGSRVVEVDRVDEAIGVTTCLERRCERREWAGAAFGPPVKAPGSRREPKRLSRLGDWRIEYATLIHEDGEGNEVRLRPTTALGGTGCATRFHLLAGDADAPFVVCSQHTTRSLHRVDGGRLVTLAEPWATTWVTGDAVVHQGAGCEPCLATTQGILSRHDERWEVIPMSCEANCASQSSVEASDREWTGLPRPETSMARDGDTLSLGLGVRAWTWDGAWAASSRAGPWAERLSGFEWEPRVQAYPTPDSLLLVGGGSDFKFRRWTSFLPADAAPAGFAYVHGVAADDILHVRAGPHAASASLAELAPTARCVGLLDATSRLSGRKWQAIALADGRRGWVNTTYVRPDPDCGPGGSATGG